MGHVCQRSAQRVELITVTSQIQERENENLHCRKQQIIAFQNNRYIPKITGEAKNAVYGRSSGPMSWCCSSYGIQVHFTGVKAAAKLQNLISQHRKICWTNAYKVFERIVTIARGERVSPYALRLFPERKMSLLKEKCCSLLPFHCA